ncbi:toll/interleukin-1 receptor domain-containing protein [Streptomyces sp. NBC_00433]
MAERSSGGGGAAIEVFVSHSSKGDPLAGKVLDAVTAGLAHKRYRVKVDSQALRPGEDWCPALYQWLAECDAAVILLNRRALESAWVRREVNILLWRRALNPRLLVIPVLIGDVSSADVKARGLGEVLPVQAARIPADPSEAHRVPSEAGEVPSAPDAAALGPLVARVLDEFAALPDLGPASDSMRRWIGVIADHLERTRKPKALTAAGRALGLADGDLPELEARIGAHHFLAYQMLDVSLGPRLADAVMEVAPHLDLDTLRRLIVQVTPAWVNGEVARQILPAPHGAHDAMTVAINVHEDVTAEQFIHRAMCLDFPRYWVRAVGAVPAGEDQAAETLAHCREAVRRLLNAPPYLPVAELKPRPGALHFLTINPRGLRERTVATVLGELRRDHPWLIVLLLTGAGAPAPDTLRAWDLEDAVVVTPPLQGGEEADGYRLARDLEAIPDRLNGSGSWR